jgi:type II secretory pathway pseudopilin PulG
MSILEVMIAMVVLLIGMVASLAAMQQGMAERRQGQNRLQKLMLADAALQRLVMSDKDALFAMAVGAPPNDPSTMPVGLAPWAPDDSVPVDAFDIGGGAYFDVFQDGTVIGLDSTSDSRFGSPNPRCHEVPVGVVCREILVHQGGVPGGTPMVVPVGAQAVTIWVRLTRRTAETLPAEADVVLRQVVVR